jgi:hypothetical protein
MAVQIAVARLFALAWGAAGFGALLGDDSDLAGEVLVWVAALAAPPMLGATVLFSRWLDRRDLAGLGLRWPDGGGSTAWRDAVVTPLAAFALAGLWLGLAILVHAVTVLGRERSASALAVALLLAAFLLQGGLEELMFRGYVFRALRERWSAPAAAVTASLVFGAMHAANPGFTAVALLNTFLAGVILASLVERSGSLWGASLAHGCWNFALAFLISEPVSGYRTPHALYLLPQGSRWLTGGDFGAEGSLLLSAIALPLAFWLWPWRRSSPPVPLSHRPPTDRERGDAIRIDLPEEARERPSQVPPLPGEGRAMGEGDRG